MNMQARHTGWANAVFKIYILRLLKKHFHSFRMIGDYPRIDKTLPAILLPNHSTWWDGFFVYLLNEKLFKRKIFLMMLEEQLQNYPFFNKVGAFGIRPQNPKHTLNTLLYATRQLSKDNLLCFFPQGELTSNRKRPVVFKPGLKWVVEKYGQKTQIIPVIMHVEMTEHQYPEVFFHFSDIKIYDGQHVPDVNQIAEQQEKYLDDMAAQLAAGHKGQELFKGRRSISEVMRKRN
ncbi:MAG: hypothetical protein GF313_16310 [Caldithrix sp.]|nr:hypothetical protein [Caldithrix sp.]